MALLPIVLLVPVLVSPAGAQEQDDSYLTATYTAVNPWSTLGPDCQVAPMGKSVGFGGACFTVPSGMTHYRVTAKDDVLGPGFGAINLCIDTPEASLCSFDPICDGVAEGEIPPGTTSAAVVVYGPVDSFCWPGGLMWAPIHGTITLDLAPVEF